MESLRNFALTSVMSEEMRIRLIDAHWEKKNTQSFLLGNLQKSWGKKKWLKCRNLGQSEL